MKKLIKKSISCIIAVLMVFSAMPLSAFAWSEANLTFVKKDTSWDGYAGKYSAYVHNGSKNDFMGIVLKEVSSDGVIEVRKGSNFDITLSCGTWTSSSASNGTLPNNTLSWHYGNKDTAYVISSVDNSGSGLTHWKAFLGDDTTTEIQSAIEGEFATAATPSDSFRARANEGGTNEAYGVFKFTPTSFSQLNTPGEYTVRLAPTLVMNHWEGGWLSKQWEPKYGWGNYQWSINQGSPDTSRTIAIKVKVVADYEFRDINGNKVGNTITAAGATDALNNAPANTATTYTNSGNGFHNLVEYNWPTTPVLQGSIYVFNESPSTTPGFCTGGTATCTSAKICDYCKTAYGSALGHSFTTYNVTNAATCSATGTKVASCDRNCGATEEQTIAIDPDAHNYGAWTSISDTQHQRVCTYNNSHTEIGNHTFENGVCTVCSKKQTFTIKFKNQDGSEISSKVYNYGETVEIPDLPPTKYTYNNNETHTVTTYSWNFTPNTVAQGNATYQVTASNSNPVACTFTCTASDIEDGDITKDEFTCSVCGGVMYKVVADMSALKANITVLEIAVNVDDAAYKYDATALAAAKEKLDEAKAYVANDNNRYASIEDVNAMSTSVGTAYTKLTVDGLAKYNQTFIIRKDDGNGNTTDLATFTQGYENLAYGSTVEFDDYTIPTINDGSTLTGLPMYAVYKWVKIVNGAEQKLGTTDVQISDVVKGNATYICYVLDFKATDEAQTTTRVRYLDKTGNTIEFDTATVGASYTRKDTSIAPHIPYYNCTGWELVFGDETNVGTRELVYRAIYTFNETEANRCTIVGLDGVYVNGTTGTPGYTAYYDEKIELTGADKYAYANADGSIIAPINENYIFAPHLNGVDKTIYITKVETPITEAKSIITGVFTTHDDPTYNYLVVNAQYYLPEGAKAVEAGAVIGKYNNADTLKIGSAVKVVSDTQGDNHEYSLQMSYSKGKTGTLYARSYLIYVDSNGDTQTVYSDDITTCNLD